MKLSDENIDVIIYLSESIIKSLKKEGFSGKAKDEEFLQDLRRSLKQKQSGIRENVCIHCLGTGYKNQVP